MLPAWHAMPCHVPDECSTCASVARPVPVHQLTPDCPLAAGALLSAGGCRWQVAPHTAHHVGYRGRQGSGCHTTAPWNRSSAVHCCAQKSNPPTRCRCARRPLPPVWASSGCPHHSAMAPQHRSTAALQIAAALLRQYQTTPHRATVPAALLLPAWHPGCVGTTRCLQTAHCLQAATGCCCLKQPQGRLACQPLPVRPARPYLPAAALHCPAQEEAAVLRDVEVIWRERLYQRQGGAEAQRYNFPCQG